MRSSRLYLAFLILFSISIKASRFCTNFGIDFNYAHYSLGSIANQSGYLAGPHVDFSYKKASRVYTGLHFDGKWNAGLICSDKPDLCNTSCQTGGSLLANVADYLTDWRLGYYYSNDSKTFSLIPSVGIGFQHLSYEVDPSIMRYKYYQMYLPIDLKLLYHSPKSFSIGCELQYRVGAYSRLRVSTPCVEDYCDSRCDDKIKLKYSQGFNIKVPVLFHYRVAKKVGLNLSLIPFFDWNTFANTCDTNSDCVVFPISDNKRWYLGVNANFSIIF